MADKRNKMLDAVIAGEEAETPTASPATPKQLAQNMRKSSYGNRKEVAFHNRLIQAPKEKVFLAPQYRPFFGNVMPIVLNGIPIYVPVNGMTYSIPRPYAAILHSRRRAVDDFLTQRNRLADVRSNLETYAGELKF